jgi:hypothetical protein
MCGDRSVEQVLADLTSSESRYQSQYARLSKVDPPDEVQTESHIALPVDDSVEQPGSQTTFETMRTQTIEMLRSIGNAWPQELVDLVTRQVREDRVQTTQLAECRKQVFNEASQPELDEPLTSDPQPHQLAGDGTAASEKQGDPATSQ